MKSRASIQSHPIHPMLVSLPIGLWTGSLAYDVLSAARGDDDEARRLRSSADDMLVAGIVGALMAAVPGIIDYLAVIPPESSAKKRGAKHGLLNVSLTAVYGCNWLLRKRSPERWGRWLGTPLSVLGYCGLIYSGWLGGTLVYRNQIGVDHRGPNATKWSETGALTGPAGEPVAVAEMGEFEKSGQMKLVHLNGHRIVVARAGERIVAFGDHCTHRGGPLADGVLSGDCVTCPWHGSQFDVETGEVRSGPAEQPIQVYPVQIEGDAIRLVAPEPAENPTIAGASGLLPPEEVRRELAERVDALRSKATELLPAGLGGGE